MCTVVGSAFPNFESVPVIKVGHKYVVAEARGGFLVLPKTDASLELWKTWWEPKGSI